MPTTETRAYRCTSYISVGLPSGRTLQLRPGDLVPPSFAAVNPHQTREWLGSGNVVLVTDPDPVALERAEAAAATA